MRRSEIAQQKVRDTAVDLLVRDGVPAFTIEEIARRSGVAKTTIYRHWPNVHALLAEAVACQIEALDTPDTGSLRGDLGALFSKIVPGADLSAKRRMVLGLLQATDEQPMLREAIEHLLHERSQPLRNLLERARDRGELRDDVDIDLAADAIEGPLVYRFMMRAEPFDQAEMDHLLDTVVAGLRPR